MHELFTFDYAVIRVVPRVEREEFINVGVIVSCATQNFLQARIELQPQRLKAFAPSLDISMIEDYLQTIPLICAGGKTSGPIGQMPLRARFHWLVAPRSTIIQMSAVHAGRCHDLEASLEQLMNRLVRPCE